MQLYVYELGYTMDVGTTGAVLMPDGGIPHTTAEISTSEILNTKR